MSLTGGFQGTGVWSAPRRGLESRGELQAGDQVLKIMCGGPGRRWTSCPRMGRESLRQG